MSYIPGFRNDIYISYVHMDNTSLGKGPGWIDYFHKALEVRVSQMLGEEISIGRDLKSTDNGKLDENVLTETALLVCLVSPAYVRSKYCLRELQQFMHSTSDVVPLESEGHTRVFKVLKSPIPFEAQPEYLSRLLGYEFYAEEPTTGRIREFRQIPRQEVDVRFWERLDALAHDIIHQLRQLQSLVSSDQQHTERESSSELQPLSVIETNQVQRQLKVFLCHSSDDKAQVRSLSKFLQSQGVAPWLDEEMLLPGQLWEDEIHKAVQNSDAIIVCLSTNSISKRGYAQKEIRKAIDVAEEQPEGAIFLIPARLEDCEIPDRLSRRQWVNLFEEQGKGLLMRALVARASQLSVELRAQEL